MRYFLIIFLIFSACKKENTDKTKFNLVMEIDEKELNSYCLNYYSENKKYVYSHLEGKNIICEPAMVWDKQLGKLVHAYKSKDPLRQLDNDQKYLEKSKIDDDHNIEEAEGQQ